METVFRKIHPANIMILLWPKECKYITKEALHFRLAWECFWTHLLGELLHILEYILVIYIIQQSPAPNIAILSKILTSLIQKSANTEFGSAIVSLIRILPLAGSSHTYDRLGFFQHTVYMRPKKRGMKLLFCSH